MKTVKPVWLVRHRDGWCAIKGNKPYPQNQNQVPTLCGYTVTLPWGSEKALPDCPECFAILAGTSKLDTAHDPGTLATKIRG